ncbi:hypothetical protein V3C99_001192 [Haemonchus contortus]
MKDPMICAEMEKVPTDPLYISIFSFYTLSFTLSLFITPIVWYRFCRRTAFHINVKILISVLFIFGIISSAFGLINYLFHMYHFVFPSNPCSRIFYASECAWSFYSLTCCIFGFMLAQASLTIERLIATYRLRTYEKGHQYLGPIMATIVVVSAICCVVWGLAEMDPKELQYQCGGVPVSTKSRVVSMYKIMLLVDVLAIMAFGLCYYYNRRTLKCGRYELSVRYQVYENLRAIRIFVPVVTAHFIIFGFFLMGSIIIREFRASLTPKAYGIGLLALYIIPFYILTMCTLLFVILRKESNRVTSFQAAIAEKQNEKEQQAETYFRSLRHQWGT